MALSGKVKSLTLLELLLDACLLVAFCLQALVAGCLLTFGKIPVPAEWANALIAKYGPNEIRLSAESYSLSADGKIYLEHIKLYDPAIDAPVVEAEAAEIQLSLLRRASFIGIDDFILTGGAAYLPAVYAPSGQRTVALDQISFELLPGAERTVVTSFAAKHEDIYVRGTIDLLNSSFDSGEPTVEAAGKGLSQRLFPIIAEAIRQRSRYHIMQNPTLFVEVRSEDASATLIDLRLSSRRLKHAEFTGSNFRIDASLRLKDGQIATTRRVLTSADLVEIPRYEVRLQEVRAALSEDEWSDIMQGSIPSFTLSAASIIDNQFEFKAPILKLDLGEYPVIALKGAASGLGGVIRAKGTVNLSEQSAQLTASGKVDLLNMLPEAIALAMPSIDCAETPFYWLDLRLGQDYAFESVDLAVIARQFDVDGIGFDLLRAKGSIQAEQVHLENILLERGNQWMDLDLLYDSQSRDYAIGLIASAIPSDYNEILPSWWASIFKDFTFSPASKGLGDFIIYGNGHSRVTELVYGTAEAANLSYRGVALDSGQVRVRGRERYYEVDLIGLKSDEGEVDGRLQFTSNADAIKGPVSVRYDFEGALPLNAIISLLGEGPVAESVADFQSDALTQIDLSGAHFNQAYPEYATKSHFDLSAAIDDRLVYQATPLDYLQFQLYQRSSGLYLREAKFGYADGQGEFLVDVSPQRKINLQLSLIDADKAQSIRDLPHLDAVETDLGVESAEQTDNPEREEARLDFKLHAQGPLDNPYQFEGFGQIEIRDKKLASVRLLGPLSTLLESARIGFTSIVLNQFQTGFILQNRQVTFNDFQITGPTTLIKGRGTLGIENQALDMRISVAPFGNAGASESTLRRVTNIVNPIPKLFEFKLTGTLAKQSWRSLYDPRNIIPGL
ncbi:MAG: AsmA-like C-terminal region-containing protein [Verrucomicrobiota bacterium]